VPSTGHPQDRNESRFRIVLGKDLRSVRPPVEMASVRLIETIRVEIDDWGLSWNYLPSAVGLRDGVALDLFLRH
jgi:hypothetical protein